MTAKVYIEKINKLSLEDRILILDSLQENIAKETGGAAVDPAIMSMILERQRNVKAGKVELRSWADVKKELSENLRVGKQV